MLEFVTYLEKNTFSLKALFAFVPNTPHITSTRARKTLHRRRSIGLSFLCHSLISRITQSTSTLTHCNNNPTSTINPVQSDIHSLERGTVERRQGWRGTSRTGHHQSQNFWEGGEMGRGGRDGEGGRGEWWDGRVRVRSGRGGGFRKICRPV